jgi:2-polyprenyl-3-methyl-5-hydroxy-6-metoxy-1,4-benzoquinol methylase
VPGCSERGQPVGTWSDKYTTRNLIAASLVRGFEQAVRALLAQAVSPPQTILEVGCGEGYTTKLLAETGLPVRAVDWSRQVIAEARALHSSPSVRFEVRDLHQLTAPNDSADIVVALEVLEHVADPHSAMRLLAALAGRWLLLSVPREPLWRLLNLARGHYMARMGNTPGHVNHWSTRGFARFVGGYAEVVRVRTPLPWTVLLARRPNPPRRSRTTSWPSPDNKRL